MKRDISEFGATVYHGEDPFGSDKLPKERLSVTLHDHLGDEETIHEYIVRVYLTENDTDTVDHLSSFIGSCIAAFSLKGSDIDWLNEYLGKIIKASTSHLYLQKAFIVRPWRSMYCGLVGYKENKVETNVIDLNDPDILLKIRTLQIDKAISIGNKKEGFRITKGVIVTNDVISTVCVGGSMSDRGVFWDFEKNPRMRTFQFDEDVLRYLHQKLDD